MENVSGGANGGNYYSAGFAYYVKRKGHIIQIVFPQVFDILCSSRQNYCLFAYEKIKVNF